MRRSRSSNEDVEQQNPRILSIRRVIERTIMEFHPEIQKPINLHSFTQPCMYMRCDAECAIEYIHTYIPRYIISQAKIVNSQRYRSARNQCLTHPASVILLIHTLYVHSCAYVRIILPHHLQNGWLYSLTSIHLPTSQNTYIRIRLLLTLAQRTRMSQQWYSIYLAHHTQTPMTCMHADLPLPRSGIWHPH